MQRVFPLFDHWPVLMHELHTRSRSRLEEVETEFAFPQRGVHLRASSPIFELGRDEIAPDVDEDKP